MKFNLHLSQDEAAHLEEALKSLAQKKGYSLSLNYLLNRWSRFVLEVERGYDNSIYEYTNDLSIRDLIEKLVQLSPQSLRAKLLDSVQPWDERFGKATNTVEKPLIILQSQNNSIHNWWYRIPAHLSIELANDLKSEGFLN